MASGVIKARVGCVGSGVENSVAGIGVNVIMGVGETTFWLGVSAGRARGSLVQEIKERRSAINKYWRVVGDISLSISNSSSSGNWLNADFS